MNIIKTEIDGLLIIEPKVFQDNRGYFFESYNEKEFIKNGITNKFVQDNQSKSSYGVIRGLHIQMGNSSQAKLVRVIQGKVIDIAVDVRKNSKTFGKYVEVELSEENKRQFLIPRYFLHGFIVLSETAIFTYKCDNFYDKSSEVSVKIDDPKLNIKFPLDKNKLIFSEKDKNGMSFEEFKKKLNNC